MSARRRGVSAEERALFRKAAGPVRPLVDDRVAPPRGRKPRAAPAPRTELAPDPRGLSHHDPPDTDPGGRLDFSRAGVRSRTARRLRTGQMRIEDDLDLHGLRVQEAEQALGRFLEHCRAHGRRCVLVVHGKGMGSAAGRPIIKSYVDRWLRLRPEVLAFSSALPRHGGTGALYVLLKG